VTKSTPMHESWLQVYLEQGVGRSVSKLIADAPRIASEAGWDRVPSSRCFQKWSIDYGWDDKAQQHDATVSHQTRYRYLCEQAERYEAAVAITLENTGIMHALVDSMLHIEIPVPNEDGNQRFTVNADGSLTPVMYRRLRRVSELSREELKCICALNRTAVQIEQDLLAGATDRYHESLSQRNSTPTVTVLGREAVREISAKADRLTRKLEAELKRKGAPSREETHGGRRDH
jgi:hypothetical protein